MREHQRNWDWDLGRQRRKKWFGMSSDKQKIQPPGPELGVWERKNSLERPAEAAAWGNSQVSIRVRNRGDCGRN